MFFYSTFKGSKPVYQHFSNLFNTYTKAFNNRFGYRAALFERPFKRRLIDEEDYFQKMVGYLTE